MSKYTKVRAYKDKELLNRLKTLENYKGLPDGYFIIGVRSEEDTYNTYDDKFYVYFKHPITEDVSFQEVLTGTTHPGGDVLSGGFLRFNKVGAAVLKSDYCHYDMWKPVYRSSRGWELRQATPTYVYRDGDKDKLSEEIGEPIYGNYGINWHTNTFKYYNAVIKWTIGAWSAGCQVTNMRESFVRWVKLFKKRYDSNKQKRITYFLLKEF
jgi:hypothetical protein